MILTTGKNPDDLTWNYLMKDLFLLAVVAMITVKISFTHFLAAVVREIYSCIKIIQSSGPN